jgi:hypothetical protein
MRRVHIVGLASLLVLAFGCIGLAQELSGTWDLDVSIDPQQTNFSNSLSVSSILKVNYSIGDWTFGSSTVLDENGWADQDFSVTGTLGAFTLTGAIDFNPDATFGSLVTTASTSIAGLLLGSQFTLQNNDTFLTFTASGTSGSLNVSVSVDLGDNDDVCDFPFDKVTIALGFPFCCANVTSALTIDCDGFDQVSLSTSGITIPNLPWLSLSAQLVYTLQTKSLTLSPTFDFGSVTCFDFYVSVDSSGNLTLSSISIDGIKMSCDFGTVTFTGISYWGETGKPSFLAGTDYWEGYRIETNADACCGPFSFDLTVYFLENGIRLFDVSMFEANFDLTLSPQFTFDMGLNIDVESGAAVTWTLGFEIDW